MTKSVEYKKIHFIGIGGVSMSALAAFALDSGKSVTGSDIRYNRLMDKLAKKGAEVYEGSDAAVARAADLVVYNSAIRPCDRELRAAKGAGIPCVLRSRCLAAVAAEHKKCVAVGGIHGKSTTSALIAAAFKRAGLKFGANIGAEAADIGGNYYNSGRDFFVAEACEYKGNFLELSPDVAVVLNVEMDHPDCYADEIGVFDAFGRFAERIKSGGTLVINADCRYARVYAGLDKSVSVLTFGIDGGDGAEQALYCAKNLVQTDGRYSFDLYVGGKFAAAIKNKLYGRHNVFNALAAIAAFDACVLSAAAESGGRPPLRFRSCDLGASAGEGCEYAANGANTQACSLGAFAEAARNRLPCIESIEGFGGVGRRFEERARLDGCPVIIDYAHHPSEIRAVIAAARQAFSGGLAVCFQPHTYSRTARLFDEFLTAFDGADGLVIFKEYPARETPADGKSAFELFCALKKSGAVYIDGQKELDLKIRELSESCGCVLLLGAGDMDFFDFC
ncbi:MAG: UDP-N-acetylmuramate--L-alanine ligase [Clostridiales bacterium]|jgi:UDP-N-acetylmuramate--alanine ligase|nr:UDP-N-acetylmuramate--L-alanine ligase [Clostridiales bacterium]